MPINFIYKYKKTTFAHQISKIVNNKRIIIKWQNKTNMNRN